jgi:hypothetical protein
MKLSHQREVLKTDLKLFLYSETGSQQTYTDVD